MLAYSEKMWLYHFSISYLVLCFHHLASSVLFYAKPNYLLRPSVHRRASKLANCIMIVVFVALLEVIIIYPLTYLYKACGVETLDANKMTQDEQLVHLIVGFVQLYLVVVLVIVGCVFMLLRFNRAGTQSAARDALNKLESSWPILWQQVSD